METQYAPVSEDTAREVIDLCSGSRILRKSGACHLQLTIARRTLTVEMRWRRPLGRLTLWKSGQSSLRRGVKPDHPSGMLQTAELFADSAFDRV